MRYRITVLPPLCGHVSECEALRAIPQAMSRRVAAVTAGQSPREDIVGEMRRFAPGVTWIQYGALDGIAEAQLGELAPVPGEFPIVTRVGSGKAIVVGEKPLRPLLERALARAASESNLVVLLCSAPFAIARYNVPVLLPDRLLEGAVSALCPARRIAVLTPVAAQVPLQQERWQRLGFDPLVLHAPPYGGADFAALGCQATREGASLAVFDCLGYASSTKDEFVAASGLPAILVRSLLARLVAELTT